MAKRKKDIDPIDAHVGKRIRMRRQQLGLSQTAIGDALGVTFQQIQKYENGTNRVSAGALSKIAERLGVKVDYFWQGATPPSATDAQAIKFDSAVDDMTTCTDGQAIVSAFAKLSNRSRRASAQAMTAAVEEPRR